MKNQLIDTQSRAFYIPLSRRRFLQSMALATAGFTVRGAFAEALTLTPKTVRIPDAARIVTDGPFAETREQLGGYYRVRADNLDQALDMAARIPAAETGSIEVRPIMDLSAYA